MSRLAESPTTLARDASALRRKDGRGLRRLNLTPCANTAYGADLSVPRIEGRDRRIPRHSSESPGEPAHRFQPRAPPENPTLPIPLPLPPTKTKTS